MHEVRRTTMNAIRATVKGGRLDLQVPPDWPDGTEVILQPVLPDSGVGIREEDWPATPEAIAEWLNWYDALEPLRFTDEERATPEADRKARREWEKAYFNEHADRSRGMWQCDATSSTEDHISQVPDEAQARLRPASLVDLFRAAGVAVGDRNDEKRA
jgi:hypothetical protein